MTQIRDTDSDWSWMAKHMPYYAVLAERKYLPEGITPQRIEEFYATGEHHVAVFFERIRNLLGDPAWRPARSLEFGCGLSRLLLPVARRSGRAIGVDIAEDMLQHSHQRARREGITNVSWLTTLDTLDNNSLDFVLSLMVFQHIPPSRGVPLIGRLCRLLGGDGVISLHVTFAKTTEWKQQALADMSLHADDGMTIRPLVRAEEDPAVIMSMYDYDLSAVLGHFFLNGIEVKQLEWMNHGGCVGVNLIGVRRMGGVQST